MPDHFGVMESHWREAVVRDENFAVSEAPHFIGRAIVALASGPAIMAMSGKALATWNRAKEYGFTDLDCTQPDWGSHARRVLGLDIMG
jgi:hypothetical protein